MLYIYVEKITDRCLYTFDFMLADHAIAYRLTSDVLFFENCIGPKLNYSHRIFDNILQIIPTTLLFEEAIIDHIISYSHYLEVPCIAFEGITDPISATFFVLSRMEEYQNLDRDHHKRFSVYSSILYKMKMHDKLVCDHWTKALINHLHRQRVIKEAYCPKKLTIRPTFDIDLAYAYLQKSGFRQMLSIAKDLLTANKARRKERIAVLSGKLRDPYDTFSTILKIAKQYPVVIFWLLGNYSKYDRNIFHGDLRHRSLIRRMSKKCTIGIHPSYFSNTLPSRIHEEIHRLRNIIGKDVHHARQHFLKLELPHTYHRLIHQGITDEYTMGYAELIGFRAGTLRAFKWFDLSKNQISELTIHPFAYMDGTLLEYQSLSIPEAKQQIDQLYCEASQFGGDFYFIWHNSTIGNHGKWKDWQQVLNYTLTLNEQEQVKTADE